MSVQLSVVLILTVGAFSAGLFWTIGRLTAMDLYVWLRSRGINEGQG